MIKITITVSLTHQQIQDLLSACTCARYIYEPGAAPRGVTIEKGQRYAAPSFIAAIGRLEKKLWKQNSVIQKMIDKAQRNN